MKVLALNGSPRRKGNSSYLLNEFLRGIKDTDSNIHIEEIIANRVHVEFCIGCLRCNSIGHCALKNDEWTDLSKKILEADILILVSPVYFRNVSASLKKLIDRFRSFLNVRVTEHGSAHKPWQEWKKEWVLILSHGSSASDEADPIVAFVHHITTLFGPNNKLHPIIGRRLGRVEQVVMDVENLKPLYKKLGIPESWAHDDYCRNSELLEQAYKLGKKLATAKCDEQDVV